MGKQGKKRAHEGGRNKGLHMRWKEYQERGSIAVHVMHTCTGNRRRRGIIFLFLEGEWPGASGASWIRSETAGSSFCVHIYYHFTLLYFLEERLDSYLTLPRLLVRPVFCVYNTFELLSNHLT